MASTCRLIWILLGIFVVASCKRPTLNPLRKAHWQLSGNKNQGPDFAQPEQVHLAYGGQPGTLSVTWVTFDDPISSNVQFGIDQLDQQVAADISRFVDGGSEKKVRYIHRAFLTGIQAGKKYSYRVGSSYGYSAQYSFTGLGPRPDGSYHFCVFGDLGYVNPQSLGLIQKQAQAGDYDMIWQIGDFAYDLHDDNGDRGDAFMRQITPAVAYVPFMTTVGNHEYAYNFSHYVNRFTMPNTDDNFFYSFDLGPVHFVVFSTEFYYYVEYGLEQIENQYKWLIRDLAKANLNREKVPWIITVAHRPMYCSGKHECVHYFNNIRTGMPPLGSYALEKIFYSTGVDLALWGHEHYYERSYPVYDYNVYNGTATDGPYVDPPAPVHIISGSAGNQEDLASFVHIKPWSAYRSESYGIGHLNVYNGTHLYFEQVAAHNGSVEDSIWLVKHKHGPYGRGDYEKLLKNSFNAASEALPGPPTEHEISEL